MRRTPIRVTALTVGVVAGLGLILLIGAMEVSSKPQMCGTCHVMAPYYESWQTSSHNQVACVECHISPGITAEFKKKFEAVSMVARYFTGTYGTNPWTEIDDSSCLRCHERRLISGKEVFGKILFDHAPHMTEMRRGKKLRCTSCHSQMVQGSHISVTQSTCILCHFKGVTPGEGTARCKLCHQVPEQVMHRGGMEFDHSDVSRFDMRCTWCHSHAAEGEGRVPRERCLTCHNDPQRLAGFDQGSDLHRAHVTDHKVDCLHCHLEIEHASQPEFTLARSECAACHSGGHSPQRDLYAGIGGKGVQPQPSTMFLAGVRCEGCHFVEGEDGHSGGVRRASDISCMSCHGPRYRAVFLQWQRTLQDRMAIVRSSLKEASPQARDSESQVVQDARANLSLVERGKGVHNVKYAFALLDKAHDFINEDRVARDLKPRKLPWPRSGSHATCSGCHAGVETQTGRFQGRRFNHRPHVLKAELECTVCHRPHEEREREEIVRFESTGCDSCHHSGLEEDANIESCRSCHGDVREKAFPTERGDFSHELHLEMTDDACDFCHALESGSVPEVDGGVCADCHE